MTDRPHDSEPPRVEQPPPETSSTRQDTRTLGERATDRMAQRADEPSRGGHGDYLRPTPEFQQALDDFKAEKAARQEDNGREGRLPDDRNYLRPTPEFQQALDDFKAEKAARQEALADEPVEQRPSTESPEVDARDPGDATDAPDTDDHSSDVDGQQHPRTVEPINDDHATGQTADADAEHSEAVSDGTDSGHTPEVLSRHDEPAPPETTRDAAADTTLAADGSDRHDGPSATDKRGDTHPDDKDPQPDGGGPPDGPPPGGGGPPDGPPRGNGDDSRRQPPDIEDVIAGLDPPDTRNTERYQHAQEASESPLIDDRRFAASPLGNLDVDTLSAAARDTYRDVAEQLGRMDAGSKADAVLDQARVNVYEAANTFLQHADVSDLQAIGEAVSDGNVSLADGAHISLVVVKCYLDRLANGDR